MSVLYSLQPISVVFEQEFGISSTEAGLFMSAALLPLGFGGLVYGYLIEKISIRTILFYAFILLAFFQLIFALCDSYTLMLNIRGLEGLLMPAVMTGLMSYTAQIVSKENISSAIGAYIAMAIVGGFLGRLLSGFFTDIYSWKFYIITTAFICLLCAILVRTKCQNITASIIKPSFKDIVSVLREKQNLYIYIMIFCLFFVFQGLLNYIPMRFMQILGDFSGTKTSLLYTGYLLGVLICFNNKRIEKLFGGAINTIIFGIIVSIFSLFIFNIASFSALFVAMLVLCVGNFIAHGIASGFVNQLATHKGITNGLYLSFYYSGGFLGSFLPAFLFLDFGWWAFLLALGVVCLFSLFSMVYLKYAYK